MLGDMCLAIHPVGVQAGRERRRHLMGGSGKRNTIPRPGNTGDSKALRAQPSLCGIQVLIRHAKPLAKISGVIHR